MEDKNRIEFFNKEIEEANAVLERQHSQIQWFVQVYLLALFGYFSVTGYLIVKTTTEIPLLSVNVIILACASIIFCLGWLLLSSLAHKISMIQMVHKHLAFMRRKRIECIDTMLEEEYVFPLEPDAIQLPGLIYHMPYLFFVLNYTLFCGSFYFVFHKQLTFIPALNLSFCAATIIGLFYPRACITFNKHMRSSEDATTLAKKQYLEDVWESKRRSKVTKIGTFIKYTILAIFSALSIVITYLSIDNKLSINEFNYLIAGLVVLIFFGILRYVFEKTSFNFNIKIKLHK